MGETLADPLPLPYLVVAVGSLLWAARRRRWIPLLGSLPLVLSMPLVNPKYEPLLNGRYLMPILPLIFASIGLVASDAWLTFRVRWPERAPGLAGALAAGLVLLGAYPLVSLAAYERSTDRTNHGVLAAYQVVAANRQPDETVLLDSALDTVLHMSAGSAFKSMQLLFGANHVPYAVIDARPGSLGDALAERSPRLLLLHGDKVTPLGRTFSLTPLGDRGRGPGYGVYRVAPRR